MKPSLRRFFLLASLVTPVSLIGAASAAPAVPSVMVGSWLYGRLSPIEYYDRGTNKWQDASGASEIVTYRADGTYERTRLLSLTTFNCTSKLFIYEKGTVKIDGDRLTYQPREGVNKGYTCKPSNSWNTTQINPETYTLHFEKNTVGKDVMVLRGKESEAHYGRYDR
ncbi:hypothetical protein [Deinococcus yavapaiensis]|uniref:Lipocalin-like protein n=1 Tax=Deinococcus yavapaiensis KR-236 TaxID=694435 RepID=A0A318SDR0_9DEIO|nr:hypothetical protein [Deinococcus yavapaiensis]PYE55191.1 hypothetical protein DES52_10320 [Deinococcus yavapaiensis KR-236]